jgi:hypothetical protein
MEKATIEKLHKISHILKQNGESVGVDIQTDGNHHTRFNVCAMGKFTTGLVLYSYNGEDQNVDNHKNSIEKVLKRLEDRKDKWDGKVKAEIKEPQMLNDWNEPTGVRISLEDVDNFIISKKLFTDCYTRIWDRTEIIFEDDDDYGYEHYLEIKGEFASIKFNYKYGNCESGADSLKCTIEPKNNLCIKTGDIKAVTLYKDYEKNITKFMKENAKYIERSFDKNEQKYFAEKKKRNLDEECSY